MFLQDYLKTSYNDFIIPVYINAPYTTVQNRAQILDTANMLQALGPVERIPFRGLNLLPKEFGPNGEPVWEIESKDGRFRLVGSGWYCLCDSSGTRLITPNVGDYAEITLYGTALNLLSGASTSPATVLLTVDGGAEGATTIFPATPSGILNGRNNNPNIVNSIVQNLSLAYHTIKLRLSVANSGGFQIFAFDIINHASSLKITPGQVFVGDRKDSLAVLTTKNFNAGFVGAYGGRAITFLKDGTISQAVRECPTSPSYLTATDHTNEEVVGGRRINCREYGTNRPDDWSTLTTSITNVSGTLDDGSSSLSGYQVVKYSGTPDDSFAINALNGQWVLTFTGSGLDVVLGGGAGTAPYSDTHQLWVDGVNQGNITTGTNMLLKLCSGLPYCEHTVRLLRTVASVGAVTIKDFLIYQPKTPILPVGAFPICDYNVPATYVANTNAGALNIATGVVRKHTASKECTYVGTWLMDQDGGLNNVSGWRNYSNTANDYLEYSFYGYGFEFRFNNTPTGTTTGVMSLSYNGGAFQVANTTNFPTLTSSFYGTGVGFSNGTVDLADASSTYACGIAIKTLPLGYWKVRITTGTGGGYILSSAFDIIPPIHINHPTFKIGSLSLINNTKYLPGVIPMMPDVGKAKAWVLFNSSGSIVASFNIHQIINVSAGLWNIYFTKTFKTSNYDFSLTNLSGSGGEISQGGAWYPHMFPVKTCNSSGTATNYFFSATFFGELFDE